MNLNKAELIGNLVADPVAKSMPSGTEIVRFTMATSRSWKDDKQQPKREVDYHAVVAFGKLGKVVLTYLKKGNKVYISGRLRTPQWQAKGKTRSGQTVIIAENLIMLGQGKSEGKGTDEAVVEEIEVPRGDG